MACSGRNCRSSLSYFQSPTAPNSTASAALARFSVDFGQRMAVGVVGGAADEGGLGLEFQVEHVQHLHGLGHDLGADAVTGQDRDLHRGSFVQAMWRSQPRLRMPSQGILASRSASKARILSAWRSVRPMSSKPLTRQYLRNGCTSNGSSLAVGLDHHLPRQVDRQPVTREGRHLVEQLGHLRFGQHDGQDAVLEAVVEEDVGEAGRDQRAEAVLPQRPGRVLAAGAAAEVLARDAARWRRRSAAG
jgi:hypothetical protein